MAVLVLYPAFNSPPHAPYPTLCDAHGTAPAGVTPNHRCDMSGMFQPGALRFARIHGTVAQTFSNTASDLVRRKQVLHAIETAAPLDMLAYFGHGLPNALSSAGFQNDMHRQDFIKTVRRVATRNFRFLIYGCSAGAPAGFGSKVADALGGDVRVYGHTTAGRGVQNPNMRQYPPCPSGKWVIDPSDAPLFRAWSQSLESTTLWATFFLVPEEELPKILAMPLHQIDQCITDARSKGLLIAAAARVH